MLSTSCRGARKTRSRCSVSTASSSLFSQVKRNGKRRTRRSPQHLAGVGLDDEDPAVRVGVREHVLLPGSPGRRDRRDPPLQQPVVCPVADDDAQRGTGQVGDAEPAGRPAGRADVLARERPVDVALGHRRVERDELAVVPGGDELRVRRPRRARVLADEALAAVSIHDPDAVRGGRQNLSGRGQAQEHGLHLLALHADYPVAPERVADPVGDRGAGRRHADRDTRADDRERHEQAPGNATLARNSLAREKRLPHDVPCTLLGGVLAGDGLLEQQVPEVALLHSSDSPSWLCKASRPRRSRELTVPRGSSSSSAISPGVYSSR